MTIQIKMNNGLIVKVKKKIKTKINFNNDLSLEINF